MRGLCVLAIPHLACMRYYQVINERVKFIDWVWFAWIVGMLPTRNRLVPPWITLTTLYKVDANPIHHTAFVSLRFHTTAIVPSRCSTLGYSIPQTGRPCFGSLASWNEAIRFLGGSRRDCPHSHSSTTSGSFDVIIMPADTTKGVDDAH
jgi:hypothetical protein